MQFLKGTNDYCFLFYSNSYLCFILYFFPMLLLVVQGGDWATKNFLNYGSGLIKIQYVALMWSYDFDVLKLWWYELMCHVIVTNTLREVVSSCLVYYKPLSQLAIAHFNIFKITNLVMHFFADFFLMDNFQLIVDDHQLLLANVKF